MIKVDTAEQRYSFLPSLFHTYFFSIEEKTNLSDFTIGNMQLSSESQKALCCYTFQYAVIPKACKPTLTVKLVELPFISLCTILVLNSHFLHLSEVCTVESWYLGV